MSSLSILRLDRADEWLTLVESSWQHDFYHLPAYHALAESQGEGRACLVVYRESTDHIVLPLLIRPVPLVPGLAECGVGWWDATSVYGYAGPLVSRPDLPVSFIQRFQESFSEWCEAQRIVSIFSRLHPLLPQAAVLTGLGEIVSWGQTISIDLQRPLAAQFAAYRKSHRYEINRMRRMNVMCEMSTVPQDWEIFIAIYTETMHRVKADAGYFLGKAYFDGLRQRLPDIFHLFLCRQDAEVLCGGLFTSCDGIVQYHLSGAREAFMSLSPTKLMLDEVRLWANAQGARVFHLGGGVGSKEDSLFLFKAGFSDCRHDFRLWRWICNGEAYSRLVVARQTWHEQQRDGGISETYFPTYRS